MAGFVEYDEESESIQFSKHITTKDLNIEDKLINGLPAVVVEDARIQVNRNKKRQ